MTLLKGWDGGLRQNIPFGECGDIPSIFNPVSPTGDVRKVLCPRLRPRRKVTLGSIFEHVEERPNLTSVVEDTAPSTFDNEAGNG
ncbi:hypothetical protein EVAR_10598_1 [Eumeta japonica]|uniref:Uncharacterized protein n=1 Tax=Eumeta variegata TaxID=151549 RepID=A0A4C1U2P9_EUMVA|nr:hypothetical protein EVAR_10598_1 [Eumeta japonica]